TQPLASFWRITGRINRCGAMVAAAALLGMMALVCCDVVLRQFGLPVKGAYDIVRILSVVALSCALPATTASKSHVSIDYFFHKFNRAHRRVIDILLHASLIAAFCLGAVYCAMAGWGFLKSGQGSDTLHLPIFWVPWIITLGLLLSACASLRHLFPHE
ncbi:MAG: TRAP transporter small permease, partial [Kiritimatiellaeota bacterium]|nr:TRAP transporter small permease [Kiritimatiellota bacterium]